MKKTMRCPGRRGRQGGVSSYGMQDPDRLFQGLNLQRGEVFLDLGCGAGDYAVAATSLVGEEGRVIALERDEGAVEALRLRVRERGIANLSVRREDLTEGLSLEDASADVCFLGTVLHIPGVVERQELLFRDIRRVLRPGGRLAVLECQPEGRAFGPPRHLRLAPEEVRAAAVPWGFVPQEELDLGVTYLLLFTCPGRGRT